MSVMWRAWTWLEALSYDLRSALRGLRREWTFSLTAIAMLAVAIALNATVFVIVNAMVFRGFPLVKGNGRLLYVQEIYPSGGCCISYPDVQDWRSEARSFQGLGYVGQRAVTLRREDGPAIDATVGVVSANTFGLLGVPPMLGRDFGAADEAQGAAPIAMLSHRFWESEFDKRADIVGVTLRVSGEPVKVVGVMPEGFTFPAEQSLWMPVTETPQMRRRGSTRDGFIALGRLRDGAHLQEARAELEAINRRLAMDYPMTNRGVTPIVRTYSQLFVGDNARRVFGALWVGASFVFLIACANVANLTLVRTSARSREFSTRLALGARQGRMLRQLFAESLMLASVAGALGWWITTWSVRRWAVVTASRYQILDYTLDSGIVVYVLAISIAAAVLCSVAPFAMIVRLAVSGTLTGEARRATQGLGRKRLATTLVAGQMALAVVLFSGTGVLGRSYLSIVNADIGVRDPEHVLVGALTLPADTYPDWGRRLAYFDRLAAQLRTIPGVEGQSFTTAPPVNGVPRQSFEIEGTPRPRAGSDAAQLLTVGSGYVRVLGASTMAGREFNDGDQLIAPPVAMVNQRLADQFSPGTPLLGRRLRVFGNRGEPGQWLTVVGIASNVIQGDGIRQQFQPVIYVPIWQSPHLHEFVLLRTTVPPEQVVRAVRAEMLKMDPEVFLGALTTMKASFAFDRDRMDGEHSELGKYVAIAPAMTLIALPLAALGLIAVIAQSVSQRRKEIGVRMAIGATAKDVRRMVLREGMAPVAIGMILGVAASLGVNRVLQSQLVGVSPYDPLTMGTATAVLIIVALLACLIPIRSAVGVDPAVALRHD